MSAERSVNTLTNAQRLKKDALRSWNRVVRMPINLAALAFGISVEEFYRLGRESQCLVVTTVGSEVFCTLGPMVFDLKRNLWDELVETLGDGRGEASKGRDEYERLYFMTQRARIETGENALVEMALLRLGVLYEGLPMGMKKEIKGLGIAPENLFNQGVLGSPADFS